MYAGEQLGKNDSSLDSLILPSSHQKQTENSIPITLAAKILGSELF